MREGESEKDKHEKEHTARRRGTRVPNNRAGGRRTSRREESELTRECVRTI